MNKTKIIAALCIALCVVGLGMGMPVLAGSEMQTEGYELEKHVEEIQIYNEELASTDIVSIPATITLENNITYQQLSEYILGKDMEIVQLQARGIDSNGDIVTFASKTYKGLAETDEIIKELAENNEIKFIGYNAMYVLVNANQIMNIQNDDLTFLLETSLKKEADKLPQPEEAIEFPHSLAWKLEKLH